MLLESGDGLQVACLCHVNLTDEEMENLQIDESSADKIVQFPSSMN